MNALAALLGAWLLSFGQPAPEAHVLSVAAHIYTSEGECSGTAIYSQSGDVMLLTARHCVDDQIVKYVQFGGKSAKYRRIVRVIKSRSFDLASIELTGAGAQPATELSQNDIVRGRPFTLIGLSYDVPWAIARGFVMSDPVKETTDGKHYRLLVPVACQGCDEGDSGGGVFDNAGQLAGVFVAGSQNNVRGYYVPLSDVKAFLAKVAKP